MGDAEALLLIDDDEAEILESHVPGNEAVGADDEVHRAVLQSAQGFTDFGGGAEAVEQVDLDRVVGHPFAEGSPMLLRQHGRGHEDGDLLAAGDRLERGADGDLGFSKSDVAADQPVHRAGGFEVVLGFLDRAALVGGFREMEGSLEFPHPARIRRVGEALLGLALGLHAEQLRGVVEDGFLRRLAGIFPCRAAELVEFRRLAAEADVFPDEVRLFQRHS